MNPGYLSWLFPVYSSILHFSQTHLQLISWLHCPSVASVASILIFISHADSCTAHNKSRCMALYLCCFMNWNWSLILICCSSHNYFDLVEPLLPQKSQLILWTKYTFFPIFEVRKFKIKIHWIIVFNNDHFLTHRQLLPSVCFYPHMAEERS